MMTKKAIAVLSGGLDSCVATCVYAEDYEIHGITFNYGQKSFKQELKASKEICKKMGFTHEVIDLPWLNKISNSSLTSDNEIPTLTHEELDDLDICEDTASSVWVPGRNIVFTSIATSYAESIGAEIIIVGWDKEEAATFPDNSKEFLESFNNMLNVGSPQNIEIKAPAIDLKVLVIPDCVCATCFPLFEKSDSALLAFFRVLEKDSSLACNLAVIVRDSDILVPFFFHFI